MEENLSIHCNPDAKAWALEYAKYYDTPDVGTMIGWFANAMMAMHDHIYITKNVTDRVESVANESHS